MKKTINLIIASYIAVFSLFINAADMNKEKVNLLFLYDKSMLDTYGINDVKLKLDNFTAVLNQVYEDSKISVEFRQLSPIYIPYDTSDFTLRQLRDWLINTGNNWGDKNKDQHFMFKKVYKQRTNISATDDNYPHLISFMRPLIVKDKRAVSIPCGIAQFPFQGDPSKSGYSAFQIGYRGSLACSRTFTFSHEIGHNFGAGHAHDNGGLFSYSHGIIQGENRKSAGSLMSYPAPGKGLFLYSDPDLTCDIGNGEQPCGNEESANNVKTIKAFIPFITHKVKTVATDKI